MDEIALENIRGLFFCGKKSTTKFSATRTIDSNGNCPNDYKICGKDS